MVLLGLQAPLLGEQPGNGGVGREGGREKEGSRRRDVHIYSFLNSGVMLSNCVFSHFSGGHFRVTNSSTAMVDGVTNELQ